MLLKYTANNCTNNYTVVNTIDNKQEFFCSEAYNLCSKYCFRQKKLFIHCMSRLFLAITHDKCSKIEIYFRIKFFFWEKEFRILFSDRKKFGKSTLKSKFITVLDSHLLPTRFAETIARNKHLFDNIFYTHLFRKVFALVWYESGMANGGGVRQNTLVIKTCNLLCRWFETSLHRYTSS